MNASGLLPALRDELDLFEGSSTPQGAPSWTLHDPSRNLYFRIDWPTLEILRRWHMDDPVQIAQSISRETTLTVSALDVANVIKFLANNQLLRPDSAKDNRQMAAGVEQMQGSIWQWLLHHYLFFRIPLVNPDAWLAQWLPVYRKLRSPGFALLTFLATLWGLSQVYRQWDVFSNSLLDTFNLEGLFWYGLALVGVKVLHELGHAFTTRHFGCQVPAMGVAFLVMWPVAYTDTNDSWRLRNSHERLQIAMAGIITESVIAGWATAAWALLPEGGLRSAMLFLATTSWISTILINASPFMRFDGYFMLCDALDMPNLHGRSFDMARWQLRKTLFGLNDAPPEDLRPGLGRLMVAFAWATWLYRLVLFIGIALLVYTFFFKALGILLFAVEIVWFIAWPVRSELTVWKERWPDIRQRPRSQRTALLALAVGLLLCVPWPGRLVSSAVLRPAQIWPIHAPAGARLDALHVVNGQMVGEGAVLMEMSLPQLESRRRTQDARQQQLQAQASQSALQADARQRLLLDQQQALVLQAEADGLAAEASLFAPRAPFDGKVHDIDPDLMPGQWLGRNEKVAQLVKSDSPWLVEAWVTEDEVARIRVGDSALFMADGGASAAVHARVSSIDADATRTLSRPELAADAGGTILTRPRQGKQVPEQALFRVTLDAGHMPETLQTMTRRGRVTIHGQWQAPMARFARQAGTVLMREMGF